MSAPSSTAPRILLVRFGAMGDIVHSLPAAAALRRAFPQTRLDWLVEQRWSPLLSTAADMPLNEVIAVDTFALRRSLTSREGWSAVRSLIRRLRRNGYDIAVDLQGAIKSALACKLSGARQRYGLAAPWLRETAAGIFYTHKSASAATHIVDAYADLVVNISETAGGIKQNASVEFPLPQGNAAKLPAEIPQENLIVMNPGAGWPSKQWPAAHFALLCDEVASRLGGTVVLNCGPGERGLAEQVQRGCRHVRPILFSGDIPAMIALMHRARLMVGPDTGPLHLAAALGVPVIGIFGPTDPRRNGPYGPAVRALRAPGAKTSYHHDATPDGSMNAVSVEMVLAAMDELLARQPQS